MDDRVDRFTGLLTVAAVAVLLAAYVTGPGWIGGVALLPVAVVLYRIRVHA